MLVFVGVILLTTTCRQNPPNSRYATERKALALRSVLPMEPQRRASRPKPAASIPEVTAEPLALPSFPQTEPVAAELIRSLRALHLLLRSARLYDRQHPRLLQSLDGAYESLRSVVAYRNGLEIRVERSGIVVPKLSEAPLPDARGDLYTLAKDLQSTGIYTLIFAPKFHVGELDTLAQLAKASLSKSGQPTKQQALAWWPAKLREHRVEGIAINAETERKVDTVLASLIAALVFAVKMTSCVDSSTSTKCSNRRRALSMTAVLARDAETIRLADLYQEFVFDSAALGIAEGDLGLSLRQSAAREKE